MPYKSDAIGDVHMNPFVIDMGKWSQPDICYAMLGYCERTIPGNDRTGYRLTC